MKKIVSIIIVSLILTNVFAEESSNGGDNESPYQLDWLTDGIVVGSGILLFTSELLVNHFVDQIPASELNPSELNINDVNSFDRLFGMSYNKGSDIASDILVLGLMALPATLAINQSWRDIGIISAMYAETLLISYSLKELVKGCVTRYRPYNYFDYPDSDFNNSNSADSFFSGHTSLAFSSAAFFTTVFSSYHPDSPLKYVVGGGSFALAATVSILRMTSGKHFMTDVVAGAAIGSLIGWFIPFLHRNRDVNGPEINLYTNMNSNLGISFSFRY